MNHTTPVVILRSGHHGGLGIVRSLGRLGVPIYCIDADPWETAFSSRYCRRRFILDLDKASSLTRLLDIGRSLGAKPILIPTTDQGAIWIAEQAATLKPVFSFPSQSAALVHSLCNKGKMHELARQAGVPTAQSMVPRSKKDVEHFIETAVFPIMVKATDARALRSRLGATKLLVESRSELLDLYGRAGDQAEPNLLLQEFIPGEDWMFNGYFDQNARCIFGITGKKIRRFPIDTGVTSLGVCLPNKSVERITIGFMEALGFRGILDIGYRLDRRDHQYKVLDVNPRIGCTFRLFVATNGMDVARALYLNLTGQQVDGSLAQEGRRWIVEDFDVVTALRSWRNGSLTLNAWANSLRGVEEAACFARDDPMPFLLMPLADCCELLRWLRRKKAASAQSRRLEINCQA